MKILYYSGWTLTRVISKIIFRIKVTGQEHVPHTGGFILATNHISYYDPLLAGSWAPRQVYFFAKLELFSNPLFGWVLRRVNALPVKRGTVDRTALERSEEVISKGYGLTIFPEGTRSKISGFLDPKPGVGLLASRAGCPVVPAYIHGSNRLKDCFWGRERLGVYFGEPLPAEWVRQFSSDKDGYQKIAESILERIAAIRDQALGLSNRPA